MGALHRVREVIRRLAGGHRPKIEDTRRAAVERLDADDARLEHVDAMVGGEERLRERLPQHHHPRLRFLLGENARLIETSLHEPTERRRRTRLVDEVKFRRRSDGNVERCRERVRLRRLRNDDGCFCRSFVRFRPRFEREGLRRAFEAERGQVLRAGVEDVPEMVGRHLVFARENLDERRVTRARERCRERGHGARRAGRRLRGCERIRGFGRRARGTCARHRRWRARTCGARAECGEERNKR